MILSTDTHLGRYGIRSKIGAGGMGEVYRARALWSNITGNLVSGMTDRTIGAVLAAIVLGPFFGSVVATSGYAGLTILAFACFFAPLVVSLIADRRIILLALLPNPLLILTWLMVVGVQHPEEQHFGHQTISVILLFAILAIPSLLVSVPIYLIRRFLSKERPIGQ